jgi:predicted nuclease of predicted toxin-antitoxin system
MNGPSHCPSKTKFIVDESAGSEIAKALQECGYDAKRLADAGVRVQNDDDLFTAAWKDNRVIVTHNQDFLDNGRFPPTTNPGVIVIRAHNTSENGVARCLVKALRLSGDDAAWFRAKKLDFASDQALTITSPGSRHRYEWKRHK